VTRARAFTERDPGSVSVSRGANDQLSESQNTLLEVKDFRTWFHTERGTVRAVDGVSFSLERGRTLGVVGESGSGKTVLSRSLMGLLARTNIERSGEVIFEGQNLLDFDFDDMHTILGAKIAMIFQDPMTSLNPVMRIGRQLAEAPRLHQHLSKSEARALARDLLRSVHIPDPDRTLRRYPHELSGGMRQRVMIAIAISCGPKLLIADEPTTALDVTVQQQILDLLEEKQRERDMTMVLISHDLGVVATRTDRIAVMYAGKIVESAPTAELFSAPRMPYTEALLRSIPRLDDDRREFLYTIGGRPPSLIAPPPGCRFAPRCAYAQERCRREEPQLEPSGSPDHLFACWFPLPEPPRVGSAQSSPPLERIAPTGGNGGR
jgi:peptide/nickel transport system ATP-binding protein